MMDRIPLYCPFCGNGVFIHLHEFFWESNSHEIQMPSLTGVYHILKCPHTLGQQAIVCFEGENVRHTITLTRVFQ